MCASQVAEPSYQRRQEGPLQAGQVPGLAEALPGLWKATTLTLGATLPTLPILEPSWVGVARAAGCSQAPPQVILIYFANKWCSPAAYACLVGDAISFETSLVEHV